MAAATQRSGQQAGDAADAQGVRSIRRALDILSLLTDDKPVVSVRDITDATGLPKTTVLRLVHTLEQSGLLWATSGGYMAGRGCGAGLTWPGGAGSCRRRRRRRCATSVPSTGDGQPVRAA